MQDGAVERTGVRSDETLFAIVEQLREANGAGVTELANRLGLAKSTVHDHLTTMCEHGFAVREGSTYRLGLQFFAYGHHLRSRRAVYRTAKPVVDELEGVTGEMVWLLVHENGRVMFIYGHSGRTDVNVDSLVGSWAHMHCNSSGKAILAHLSDAEVAAVIERHGLPARTPNTITDPAELRATLDRVRERGYALNLGEDLEGIHAVSVPLSFDDEVHGALAVAGPAHRVTEGRCRSELADQLLAARNDLELNLAYQ
jgi:DNA-binding IclR family transcriptional regulator